MKRIGILLIICLISVNSFSDSKITRGSNIGEIYFIGPTYTGLGLYYSTDFGETTICADSTFSTSIMSICADKTEGVVYYVTMGTGLYVSFDYGNVGTWNLTSGGIKINLNSGRNEGEIYSSYSKKSTDYGQNFYWNTCNGWFGNTIDSEIDNMENHGYACVYSIYNADTIFLLKSNDDFENLEVIKELEYHWSNDVDISRGFESGELYLLNFSKGELFYTNDYFQELDFIESFNFSNDYNIEMVGGRQTGEIFILYNFVNLMWLNAHTYIYHSTDFGKTFETFHPFAKGNEPVLANFSSTEKEVLLTTPVEFSNFSIGGIQEYQWDFENDGIIDSYDEFPTHIYQDTGYYSVKLSVVGQDSTNTFIKENYIHVIDTITGNPELQYHNLKIYPNPFNEKITIKLKPEFKRLENYDLNGKNQFTKTLNQENKTEIIDLKDLEKGIYILKIKTEEQDLSKKIIKI